MDKICNEYKEKISVRFINAKKVYTPIGFVGGIMKAPDISYLVTVEYTSTSGEKIRQKLEGEYSFEQMMVMKAKSNGFSALKHNHKIFYENEEEINIDSDLRLKFFLEENKQRSRSINFSMLFSGFGLMLVFALIIVCFNANHWLSGFQSIVPCVYLVSLGFEIAITMLVVRSINRVMLKKQGVSIIATVEEIYDDRSIYNKRKKKTNKQMNINSTHEFTFIRYSYVDDSGQIIYQDEILKPNVYLAIYHLKRIPICVKGRYSCIDEDKLYLGKFEKKGG